MSKILRTHSYSFIVYQLTTIKEESTHKIKISMIITCLLYSGSKFLMVISMNTVILDISFICNAH